MEVAEAGLLRVLRLTRILRTLRAINVGMTRAYCDHVIKLSDTLQPLPRAVVCNVHGVRGDFLRVGRAAARPFHRWSGGAYFLGKVLWAKGHRLLLEYLMLQQARGDAPTHIDVYGGGEDLKDIKNAAMDAAVDLTFFPPTDHADPALRRYKVFVNPSRSEVLSTTTAEALAMGKFVVLERHPSNDFFVGFANALPYDTAEEFLSQLQHALASTPAPLTDGLPCASVFGRMNVFGRTLSPSDLILATIRWLRLSLTTRRATASWFGLASK